MKTVEELARMAWFLAEGPSETEQFVGPVKVTMVDLRDELISELHGVFSNVRDLVLEEAALAVYTATDNMHDERDMVLKEIIADAIRAMKEQK